MTYLEGVDYFIRYRPFPCTTIYAWAVSLGDGTFDIWLNTRVSREKQLKGLRHDLKHLVDNHFYRDDLTLAEKEAIAWGLIEESNAEEKRNIPDKIPNVFDHQDGVIPVFNSLDIFQDYMLAMREQVQKEIADKSR